VNGGAFGTQARCTSSQSSVQIGDCELSLEPPKNPELVPLGYGLGDQEDQETLAHLRWMLQKFSLGQDVFLLGGPGPRRRRLALHICELAGLEVEYVRVTRDTTEADLKQRRDILGKLNLVVTLLSRPNHHSTEQIAVVSQRILHNRALSLNITTAGGNATWTDQAPVRAALHGRVLILDGMEKVHSCAYIFAFIPAPKHEYEFVPLEVSHVHMDFSVELVEDRPSVCIFSVRRLFVHTCMSFPRLAYVRTCAREIQRERERE
jgi:hypothetical protein